MPDILRPVRIDKPRAGGEIAPVEELRRRNFHRARIGDRTVAASAELDPGHPEKVLLVRGEYDGIATVADLEDLRRALAAGTPLPSGRSPPRAVCTGRGTAA